MKKIIFVAAECAPFAKVGGLADVIGSLPKAIYELGADVSVIIPYYGSIFINQVNRKIIKKNLSVKFNKKSERFHLWESQLPNSDVPLLLVDNKKYFSGEPYSPKTPELDRFLFFSQAVSEVILKMKFKIVHCHDWHTAMIPFLLRENSTKTVFTIHNIAYQGIFEAETVNRLIQSEFKEKVNFMHKGIEDSDIVTTVSPNYAKEILTPEFGFGLEKILKKKKNNLFGIINGISPAQFSPENDEVIVKKYSIKNIRDREINKLKLQKECFGEESKDVPLIGMVTRIAEQKGFDLIEKILPKIIKTKLQLVVLGAGITRYENLLKSVAKNYPDKVFAKIGFDDRLAHKIYAGSDIFLMPSHFEPCGLGQMIAMTYGSVPIVRGVGGLKDTVISIGKKNATGFVFKKNNPETLWSEIKKALHLFKNKDAWFKIQKNGMTKDFSWKKSAKKYMDLYGRIGG